MQDYLKEGGLEVEKNGARKRARNFFNTPFLIAVFPSLLVRSYYSFRRTGMGISPPPIARGRLFFAIAV